MKLRVYTFLLIVVFTIPLSLYAKEQAVEFALTDSETLWLRDHQILRVAGPKAFPPFQYVAEDGTVAGMASDYIHILSERLGVRMEVQTNLTWPEVLQKAKDRELDVISCAARTADREVYLTFTEPYLSFPMVIISRKDAPFIGGLKDLHGKTVAVIRKVSTYEWLQRDNIRIVPHFVGSPLEALESVSVGQAEAYLGNLAASSYLIEKNGLVNLKIAAPTDYGNYDLHFAVRSDWPELVGILNKAFVSIKPEEHSTIRQKWIAVRYEYGINPAFLWRISLQIGAAVAIVLVLFILRNRQIQRSEERFRGLIEYGADIILACKQNEAITYQSPSLTLILGYSPKELLGTSVSSLFHEADKANWKQLLTSILNEEDLQTFEHRIRHKQGHYLYVESNCINLLTNKALKVIVLNARDMTQHKQAEEAFQRAKEAAETANVAKSTFLANMSHELRTPLNAILGFSQIMTRSQTLSPEDRENLGIISHSGEHLLTLINDILDMSKIEAGRIVVHKKNFNLYHLLEELEDMFRLRARKKGLQLLIDRNQDVPQYIRTDEVKLRQVLINLLSNSFKFTEDGEVTLRVSKLETRNSKLDTSQTPSSVSDSQYPVSSIQFQVADTGPGIAPDELNVIFEAFVQTKIGQKSREGTGLGLPISQRFVQMMGGNIQVKSSVGKGTTFTFNIQIDLVDQSTVINEQSKPPKRVIALAPEQPVYRILVVDDDKQSRRLLFKLLTPLGFDVQEARNGQEALKVWEDWNPHLIWMDMRMPGMNGYEATKHIKSKIKNLKSKIQTVIIALTASSFEEERAVVLSAGCDDFLRKPFRETDIFDLMHKNLGVRFVYEEEERAKGERPFDSAQARLQAKDEDVQMLEELAGLSEELRVHLRQAVETLDLETAEHLIGQIRQHNKSLAEVLELLVKSYRFDILQALFEKIPDM